MSESPISIHSEREYTMTNQISLEKKILIVDDDIDILEGYKFIFEFEGFEPETAYTPKEAIRMLKEEKFGTVVLDYMLPNIKGDELAAKLYEVDPDIKLVIISGHNNAEAVFNVRNIKIEGILKKPVEPDELVSLIKAITSD